MSAALLSGHWFRLAQLKPALRRQARVQRHVYRGQVWYVVHDRVSGEHHRFNAAAYDVIRRLDGTRSMQQIWDELAAQGHEHLPTQAQLIELLGQLNAAQLLMVDATPDVAELIERGERRQRRTRLSRFLNPLSLRLPLWDPDRFLAALAARLPALPPVLLALLWGGCALGAGVQAAAHWGELTRNFNERLLAGGNLAVMALAFMLLKACHELAHGLAVKRGGGEVHEMGLMFLLFYPVPYVDASAAHAFPSRLRRAWVCAAGMVAESWIAIGALFLWLLLEPGFARSVAYNMAVLGSASTLLFNANPLLRYDGYYILADLVEIPNLGARSTQYWQHLATRYVFGIRDLQPFAATRAERRWFLAYGPLSCAYRLLVTFGIAWFIAQQYFLFGVLFAAWTLATGFVLPLAKALRALFTEPRFLARARRVHMVLGGACALLLALLFVLPMPYHTPVEGVVALPEKALLRARADGFVTRVRGATGTPVAEGAAVLDAENPQLRARLEQQLARVEEVQAGVDAAWGTRPAEAARLLETLAHEQAVLRRLQEEAARLALHAQASGQLLIDRAQDLHGRFLKQGELVGHVVGQHAPVVRIVVPQEDVGRVRADVRGVEVRLVQDLGQAIPGTLSRAVPKAAHELPSAALGQGGGGRQVTDPRDDQQRRALATLFEFEVELPARALPAQLGARAYVRIEHTAEPVGWRWWRAARRAFLSSLGV